ncbi:CcoQ/FixQ family Cbb3-type cytochrome c oxidase assembly chaperone [Acinetobacter baumannii]
METGQILGLIFFTLFFIGISYYYTWSALKKDEIEDMKMRENSDM